MANQKYVVDALEDLIAVARDGQSGYRDGAEHAKDPQLRRFLESVGLARAKFAGIWRATQCGWGRETSTAPEA